MTRPSFARDPISVAIEMGGIAWLAFAYRRSSGRPRCRAIAVIDGRAERWHLRLFLGERLNSNAFILAESIGFNPLIDRCVNRTPDRFVLPCDRGADRRRWNVDQSCWRRWLRLDQRPTRKAITATTAIVPPWPLGLEFDTIAAGWGYAGFAPGVLHLENLPFSRHFVAFGFASGHLVNFPLASLHGAAIAGAVTSESVVAASSSFSMRILLPGKSSFAVYACIR